MKKPKKTAATKPPSGRSVRKQTKTSAKISKAKAPKTRRKVAAKKAKATTEAPKPTPASEAKPIAEAKRAAKAKAIGAPEPVLETKPAVEPTVAKKTSATAKAAPKSSLFEIKPLRRAGASAKIIDFEKLKSDAVGKAVPKLPTKSPVEADSESESKEESGEKPEMGVELIFERKIKARPKSKAKVKRVIKARRAPKTPLAKQKPKEKPKAEAKLPVEPPVAKPFSALIPPETKQSSRPARKAPAKIPPILLEGDKSEPALVSGPGQRYALGPTAPVEKLQTEGELPDSYGTGTILLTARDPHWLYTHWDLSDDQQRRYNAFSRDGHLIVRIYIESSQGKPVAQIHVHPESRHWFVHVERANTRYVAELGYFSAADKWTAVAMSAATLTPPDAVSADSSADFATVPFEVPMEKLLSLVKEAVRENAPLAQAMQELREDGHRELPQFEVPVAEKEPPTFRSTAQARRRDADAPREGSRQKISRARWTPSDWTPEQERALAEVVSMDQVRRVWMGSLEITELIRRQFVNELASMSAAEFGESAPGAPTSPAGAVSAISSPAGKPAAGEKRFWFNVNAELIVYGATEKDATVSIGGRKIKLRADGSFSYRFALPDGNYEMPVVAISADGMDGRAAELKFSRGTEYRGDVGAHPQDPALQQLVLENF